MSLIASIKSMLVDPVENAVCILRTCGLIAFGTWLVGAGVDVAHGIIGVLHHMPDAQVPIGHIARSASTMLAALGLALRLKRGFKS